FLYGEDKEPLELPGFYIAKYPITYAQFQTFIDSKDGFYDSRWWEGLAADADHRKQPGDQQWKIANHPRENVSWYDAMAFCRWLSSKLTSLTPSPSPLGRGAYDPMNPFTWAVRLPTEQEWEKAARGTDGLVYPYGNDFDSSKSNTRESGKQKTTPVTQYPNGASPYGVLDMSGNVWEWCLTEYSSGKSNDLTNREARVLRGGSWLDDLGLARAASRYHFIPDVRDDDIGFRVVSAPFS
ncbi:MAG: formylglycine-generating enzyme family protein, partial [Anaerolineae bacterium]|nr:formylglycine-generating enzyme family protein [Anaerolineae bacterium]